MLDIEKLRLTLEETFLAIAEAFPSGFIIEGQDRRVAIDAQLAKALWGMEEALMDMTPGSLFGLPDGANEAEVRGILARRLFIALEAAGMPMPETKEMTR